MVNYDIVDGKLGEVGAYDVEFKDGYLSAKAQVLAKVASGIVEIVGELEVRVGAEAVIEALKKAIPGEIDDAILDGAKKLLLASKE